MKSSVFFNLVFLLIHKQKNRYISIFILSIVDDELNDSVTVFCPVAIVKLKNKKSIVLNRFDFCIMLLCVFERLTLWVKLSEKVLVIIL